MKNECEVTFRLSADMMKKLLFVAKAEGRTINNQFLFMLRGNTSYYEKTKGKIKPQELDAIDISEFIREK
ncbi:MAG: hypothetical protein ACI4QZ_02100 [Eubacteriales bacterium]